ncbi:uncharacterized protein BYT42DRAFT_561560 [Radiomyces spectabilis]|uniref:uncharacterized protein n=1 Tax=Radiomyces spectabilis TaxID=64574 RepID=UPI0022212931|nr:uncharacterized protein BYT42DRAFT_561560 [Radiomyces spectabilis]KAI8388867.1 hypothetical protein BYT42DRAFT_561560 [Radiomyces spectabilis]
MASKSSGLSSSADAPFTIDTILDKFMKPDTGSASPTTPSSPVQKTAPPFSPVQKSGKKKRVRFQPDHLLTEVREYERDPEEWNFDVSGAGVPHQFGNARDLDISEGQQAFHPQYPTGEWYVPRRIALNEEIQGQAPIKTPETQTQVMREKTTLAAVYLSPQHIPFSPAEPDELPDTSTNTPIIPLEDMMMAVSQPPPVAPMPVDPMMNHPPPQPTVPQSAKPAQSAVNLDEAYQILRDNPSLVESLKHLASSGLSQITSSPTSAAMQAMASVGVNQEGYAKEASMQKYIMNERQEAGFGHWKSKENHDAHHPSTKRGGGGRGRGRGRGRGKGRGGSDSGPMRHERHHGKQLGPYDKPNKSREGGKSKYTVHCRYYNSRTGCDKGDECRFLHEHS